MTKVKICGLSRECDIDYANILMPDYIGFVFAKSKRQVTIEQAKLLKNKTNSAIKIVGVFVNEDIERVVKIADDSIIDMIQLHGSEDECYIENLRKITKLPIIQAFKVENKSDLEKAEKSSADYILLDNGSGGTGESFDWKYIENINREYFLAGGINLDNLKEAISYNSYAIDLSSGVETLGFKDFSKMQKVIDTIRNGE